MKLTHFFIVMLAGLLAVACTLPVASLPAAPSSPEPAAQESDSVNNARWDALLYDWIEDPDKPLCNAPGGVLLVDSPAGRYLKAAGLARVEDGQPMTTASRAEIGSITKSFTTVLALQFQEEGVLALDDPLRKWLPDLAAQIPNGEQITLRQLAGHTSGIWDYEATLITAPIDAGDQAEITRAYTPEELVQYAIANGAPDFTPGTDWKYSNTGYIVLGLALEAATGKSLAELYQERIFTPLGMTNTLYLEDSPTHGEVVDGYTVTSQDGPLVNVTQWNLSQAGAAGAIVSTVEDVALFIKVLFNGDLFQDEASLGEMLTFSPLDLEHSNLMMNGYGLGILRYLTTGFTAIGHAGQTPGYQMVAILVPEAETVVVFFTNSGSCPADFMPLSLLPEDFGLAPNTGSSFPRAEPNYTGKRRRDLSAFTAALAALDTEQMAELDTLLAGATLLDMQTLMDEGRLTAEELVTYYVARIQRYDVDRLNAVMELNPLALESARALDAERAAGKVRGALHGIPVLLKDNIATGGGMHTTAGAWALRDWQPDRDAFLVQQLRNAGAVILGKTNLSEWANYMDPSMPSGFSTLGGQTRNPYGPYDPSGSSSGSAVAAAANLAAVAVGTETQGSIIMPAQSNSVVGLKTSMGLVSRDYIVPLLEWQDVPGPIGRTVTDVAVLLTALVGEDANDPVTAAGVPLADVDFTQFLSSEAATGLRVGILINTDEDIDQFLKDAGVTGEPGNTGDELRQILLSDNEQNRQLGQFFKDLGFTVNEVTPSALPGRQDFAAVLPYGFKDALNHFLAVAEGQVGVGSLADIIAVNRTDLANRAPYGQGNLEEAEKASLSAEAYLALKQEQQEVTRSALHAFFVNNDIDVLLSDAGQTYAPAGLPAITVPSGYDESGQPTGITLVADFLGEPQLIAVAYVYEQATQARVEPDLDATLELIDALGSKN